MTRLTMIVIDMKINVGLCFYYKVFFLLHVFVSLFELVFKNLANGAEYSFVFFCLNFLFA